MKHTKQTLALLLSASMLLSPFQNGLGKPQKTQAVDSSISNPGVENDIATWDTVYFGHFWQNDTNGDGTIDQTDQKDPIRWRVLSVEGNDAFLLADQCLDCQAYNYTMTEATWDNSTLRSWLNGYGSESNASGIDYRQNNFINAAFTQAEQTAIKQTAVINQDSEIIHNGKDTSDKIYLLSRTEVSNPSYGFIESANGESNTRIAAVPSYIDEKYRDLFKKYDKEEAYSWRLRTRGFFYPLAVDDTGYIDQRGKKDELTPFGVRPVLHLDLDHTEVYSSGETISSDGTQGKPIPIAIPSSSPTTPTDTPSASPNTASSTSPSIAPDVSPSGIPTASLSPLPTAPATIVPTASSDATPTSTPDVPSDDEQEDESDDDAENDSNDEPTPKPSPKAVTRFQDKKSNGEYRILTRTMSGGTVTLQRPLKDSTKATIPATVKHDKKTYKVTNISTKAFYGKKKLKTVTVGKNVKTIGSQAFYECKKLSSVDMDSNMTTIGSKAFYNCTVLKEITLPTKVKKIGSFAFYNCRRMNELSIETKKLNSRNVGSDAFYRTGGINYKKLITDVPASKLSAYTKLLRKKGMSTKSVIMPAGGNVDAYRPAPDPVELSKDFLNLTVKKSDSGTKYGTATVKLKRSKGVQIMTATCNMKKHGIVTASINGTKNLSIKVKAKKKGETKVILSLRYQIGRKTKTKKLTLGVKVALKDTRKKSNKKPAPVTTAKPSPKPSATATPAPVITVSPTPTAPSQGTVAKDESEVAALYKIIGEQRELAASNGIRLDGIEDFDSDCYAWNEQGHLTKIDWGKYALSGEISFTDFKKLDEIKCGTGTISSVDVTGNPSLTTLTCASNALTKLDVSKNAFLTVLDCHDNQIAGLNLSQNTALTSLDCRNNKITMLNLSNNNKLRDLAHDNNVLVLGYSNGTAQPTVPTSTPSATPSVSSSKSPSLSDETAGLYDSETGKLTRRWDDLLDCGDLELSKDYKTVYCKNDTISGVLKLSNTISFVGDQAFYRCKSLTGIEIPDGVTSIGNYAFDRCSGLTEVKFPTTMKSIGTGAFFGCTNLTKLSIPKGITDIGYNTFSSCKKIAKLTLPNTVKTIGENAFSGCKKLTSLTIPNNVTDIDTSAFGDCISLTSLLIPKNVNHIGEGAFRGCSGLISIKVNAQNTAYDSRNDCNAVIETKSNTLIAGCKNTVIPNDVTGIGSFAFEDCSGLTDITIPDNVTSIGELAFSRCSNLSTLTIPDGVTSIDQYAFNEMKLIIYAGNATGSPWGAEHVQAYPITQDKDEAAALKKIIAEKKTSGGQGEISEDLNDIDQYEWDQEGHLLYINWEQCGIQGEISFSTFPFLERLYLYQNGITKLDVTGCTALKELECSWNALSSLDVSKNIFLEKLTCLGGFYNRFDTVDVSKNTALKELELSNCELSSLDVSKNTVLTVLSCGGSQIKSLDVSKNTFLKSLFCNNSFLSALDISHNAQLETLWCYDNDLSILNIGSNPNLTNLNCAGNLLTALDISKNINLTSLTCSGNQLSKLDTAKNIELEELSCSGNQLTSLDLGNNKELGFLVCFDNKLSTLNMENQSGGLFMFQCDSGVNVSNYDKDDIERMPQKDAGTIQALKKMVEEKKALGAHTSRDLNDLDQYNWNEEGNLIGIYWGNSMLQGKLSFSEFPYLSDLDIPFNQITELDISQNTELQSLNCTENLLTTLDVSKNTKLDNLYCDDSVQVTGRNNQ